MIKTITDPITWAIEFENRDIAHDLYEKTVVGYDNNTFGKRTVNNDTWYIGTMLLDDEFKAKITEFLNQYDITSNQYTVTKTAVGTFFNAL
ncbi:hypothetical protein [Companilactobacillus nantensis]|uniref:Prophage protein n=1 Tax=Companilactobacillus nantensis DSM 16982 TaxID=1423774 RepID=A0A0R1WFI4_9LACO|nr:hypothetical protein [Companilactobacillus nantensis]KRM14473.1 hypothetical protein FD31_GL001806 [Companilactobacillus nantensis DSM 16982]GEO65233.1 hypothetical protein LNA01_24160 [Companilactobacillus nantensis]